MYGSLSGRCGHIEDRQCAALPGLCARCHLWNLFLWRTKDGLLPPQAAAPEAELRAQGGVGGRATPHMRSHISAPTLELHKRRSQAACPVNLPSCCAHQHGYGLRLAPSPCAPGWDYPQHLRHLLKLGPACLGCHVFLRSSCLCSSASGVCLLTCNSPTCALSGWEQLWCKLSSCSWL